uniref:phosphatidate phosphatase n=1 Tax=Sphenodon punctatus TaxID=8508 RepID=A0A8D0L2Z9_SPHPU
MNYVGQLAETVLVTVKELYKGLNPATLTGCIDILVVRQPDGSFQCSPFHVRFGKLGVLRSREKVVDIEINGEPVDLHMKLGDNGEAFFVQESEESQECIPSCLCTSPIPDYVARSSQDLGTSQLGLHGDVEASSSETSLRKKRRRRKKPKRKESLGSTLEELEGTARERSLEEKYKMLTTSNSVYYSFTDLPCEEAGAMQRKEIYPYSDGELTPQQSLSSSHPPSPKSDSELEIKPLEPLSLGAESHMQWTWGRLPQMSKLERVEPAKSTKDITTTASVATTVTIPVGETTHFLAIATDLEGDLSTVDSGEMSSSPAIPVIKPTPIFFKGNGALIHKEPCPAAEETVDELETLQPPAGEEGVQHPATAAEEEGKENMEVKIQQILELDQAAPALRQGSSEIMGPRDSPEPKLERRRGSMKKSPHLGPSDIYLEELSNLDSEQVALYFPKSDVGLSSKTESNSQVQLPAGPTLDSGTENLCDLSHDPMSSIVLSLCGGLGDSGEISPEKFMKDVLSYQEFAENPGVLDDPNLVVQIHNKYYNWAVAAPIVLSLQAYQKNLPQSTIDRLVKEKMLKRGSRWWFSWRRKEFPNEEVRVLWSREALLSSDEESASLGSRVTPDAIAQKFLPTYKKSLRLSSDQIKSLNLRDGPNEVVFSVTTQSDALGHILPHLGKDWTHHGIAKLFHKIHLNGYRFLYCSARAIGMAHITKGYLKWVNDQGCVLPRGPILLAPSSLFSAFHRQPFHAAFGNRDKDVYAYKQVGLPESRIFTVNPKGELIQELTKNHKSTYERLSELVELIFPPLNQDESVSLVCPEFSQFSFWRAPLPVIDLEDLS